jgi:chromosome segregation ATPase
MGCSSSAERQQLLDEIEGTERNVGKMKQQLQDTEKELKSLKESGDEAVSSQPVLSVEELCDQLKAMQSQYSMEEERQQAELERQFELLQLSGFEENERRSKFSTASPSSSSAVRRPTIAQPGQKLSDRDYVRHLEAAAARRHREEAETAEKQLEALREQFKPLQEEHSKAVQDLQETREQVCEEQKGQQASATVTSSLDLRLEECRIEYARAEQRWDDLERHLKDQMKELRGELHLRGNEMRARDKHLEERDKELAEVNSQLADLQSLFDDVNQQLQAECGRIEQLQETVAQCAKQGKELESLQSMLEESHRVLAQMRDALEFERGERAKVAELLEHEQQRTQLLLDVLKHFKEKLQGLTPQMLLSRLGAVAGGDIKSPVGNGTAMATVGSNGNVARGQGKPPSQLSSESRLAAKAFGGSQEVASRVFPGGGQAYINSPRQGCAASDGMASTIAPESSSVAQWMQSAGGSAVARSTGSARTPSPVVSRLAPSPAPALPSSASAVPLLPLASDGRPPWDSQRGGAAPEPWANSFVAASMPGPGSVTMHWDMGGEAAKAYANIGEPFIRR